MRSPFTTRISSRGQIVIPGPIRKAHALEAGTSFLVLAQDDTIVLHRRQEPPWQLLKKSIVECLKGRSFSCAVASLLFCHHEEAFRPTRDLLLERFSSAGITGR